MSRGRSIDITLIVRAFGLLVMSGDERHKHAFLTDRTFVLTWDRLATKLSLNVADEVWYEG